MDQMAGKMLIGFESPTQKYLTDLNKHQEALRKATQPFGSFEMAKLYNENLLGNAHKTIQAAIQEHEKLLMGVTAASSFDSILGKNENQWATLQQSIVNDSIQRFRSQHESLLFSNAFNTIQAAIKANEKLFLNVKTTSYFDTILGNHKNQWATLQRSIDSTAKLQQSILNDSIQGFRNQITAFSDIENKLKSLTISNVLDQFRFDLSKIQNNYLPIPTINNIGALLVGEIWGVQGIQNQLDALGVDFDLQSIESYDEPLNESQLAELLEKARDWSNRNGGLFGLIGTLCSIFSIILIYFPGLVPHVSEEQQEIQYAKIEKHLFEQFKSLIEQAISLESKHSSQSEYVVKNRVALIRTEPRSGATIIASVFPNQCVTLLNQKEKWIEVEYYDWLHQKFLTGWALKKYFVSIRKNNIRSAGK